MSRKKGEKRLPEVQNGVAAGDALRREPLTSTINTEELYRLYQQLDRQALLEAEEQIERDQSGTLGISVDTSTKWTRRAGAPKADRIYAASQWQLMWRKFIRNRMAMIGGIGILLFYLVALFGNFISPYTLTTRFRTHILMPPQQIRLFDNGAFRPHIYDMDLFIDKSLRKNYTPNPENKLYIRFFVRGDPYKLMGLFDADVHLFLVDGKSPVAIMGTDHQGRDMFSRIVLGSQISLTIGLIGVMFSLIFGAVLGLVSGYFGGLIDDLIQRVIELVRSIPSIPLWMALSAAIPTEWDELQTYFAITLILSLIGWTWLARQLRGTVLSLRNEDFVLAARLAGASDGWIIFKHLLPATFGHIIVVSTLAMPSMILSETALSYLGLGLRPPITSWGVLLQEAQNLSAIALYPWLFIPALVLAVNILAFSYLGDGLRDAVDPYTI